MLDKFLDLHPSKEYSGMAVYDYIDNFWYTITFGYQRFNLRMWWCKKYGKKTPVYSPAFQKNGYLLENEWFVPADGSFEYGYDPNAHPAIF